MFSKTTFETADAMKRFQEFTDCKIPKIVGIIDGTTSRTWHHQLIVKSITIPENNDI